MSDGEGGRRYRNRTLSVDELGNYKADKSKLVAHVLPHGNVIFEIAKFNSRAQELTETTEAFITDLYELADTCNYETLRGDLIRDRMVVGLSDRHLSKKLLLNSKLTLQSAITAARASEAAERQ